MPGVTAQERVVSFGMTASGGAQAPRGPRAPGPGLRKWVRHSAPWRGGLCHLLFSASSPPPLRAPIACRYRAFSLFFSPPVFFFFLSCSLVLIFHTGKISNISLANETGVFPSDWLTFCHVNFKTLFFFFLLVFTAHKLFKIFFSLIFFPLIP